MPLQFATIEEPSFGRGIDARSSENQIRDGFVRDLVNSDIIEGRVTKRKGYTNYSGNVPVRVVKYRQAANPINKVYFTLDGSIDLSRVETTPILVYGTTGVTPSALQTVRYFPNWATNLKKALLQTTATFTSGTGTSSATLNVVSTTGFGTTGRFLYGATSYIYTGITPTSFTGVSPLITYSNGETVTEQEIVSAPFTEHSIPSTDIYVGMGLLTGNDLSNECIFPEVTIDGASYDISATYTNGGPSEEVVLFYVDGRDILGEKYATTKSGTTFTIPATGVGGHNLASTNILSQVYKDIGSGTLERVYPDQVQLNKATGDITFTFTENNTYRVLLSTAPSSQSFDGVPVADNGSFKVTLANITSPYILYSVYTNAGEEIHPDTVSYDDINKTATFVFSTYNQAISLYYIHGTVRTNEISVDTSVSASLETDSPQLTIYGLPHNNVYDPVTDTTEYGIYGDAKEINRRGWVTHLDSYKSPTTTHMVAGLGGNLFAALSPYDTYFPASFSVAFPTYYPNLNSRTAASDRVIGPAFWSLNETPNRTRGSIHFVGGSTHWATITSVAYQSGGLTRYVLSTPSLSYSGSPIKATPTSIINGAVTSSSSVTLADASSFSTSGTLLINGERYNYTSKAGNVLSGLTPSLTAANGAAVEETIGDYLTVKGMSSSRHSGVFKIMAVSYGAETITIDVINPRLVNNDYDDNGCAGLGGIFTDQVVLSGSNPFTIGDEFLSSAWGSTTQLLVDSVSNLTVTLSQVYDKLSLTASLIVTGKRTSNELPLRNKTVGLAIGDLYLVKGDTLNIDYINRPLQVTAVDTVNNVVTLDEAITWEDNISIPTEVSISRRWIPAESPTPDNSDVLLPKTTTRYLTANSYDNQPFLRSAMVQNNLYLTNGDDEVYKYDGRNFYRAGIIPWQPGLFLSVENVSSGGIPLSGSGAKTVSTLVGGKLELTEANAGPFQVGDVVRFTNAEGVNQLLTISAIASKTAPSTDKVFSFSDTLSFTSLGTSPTITLIYQARYYFRLNVKDVNGVTTASAVTGAEDFIATISPETGKQLKVLLRLVGLPPWDGYDYRNKNIELEVYRTFWSRGSLGETPAFYRIQSVGLTYEANSGYIDIVDSYSNDTLSDTQSDAVVGVLSPTPLPAAWDEPARAKYVTTAGNRLVLANVTDWPTLTVTYLGAGLTPFASFSGQKFLYRRDSSDTATATNMLDRVTYELVSSSAAKIIYPVPGTSGHFKFSATTSLPATLAAKDWVYLYHNAVSSGNSKTWITLNGTSFIFPTETLTVPSPGSLVHFETSNTLPGGVGTTSGYFALAAIGAPTATVQNNTANATTLSLQNIVGTFPPRGVILVNGNQYTYSGVSGADLTGVSPLITVTSGAAVSAVAFSVSATYNGTPITFSSTGTGMQSVLWDGSELDYAGWYQVADVTGGVVTIHSPNLNWSVIPKQFPDRALFATNLEDVPVLAGTDGNMGMTTGNGPVPWQVVLRRLGMAINATMRVTDTTLAGQEDFIPWLTARSEADTFGQLIVKQPRAEVAVPSLTLRGPSTTVNGAVTNSTTVTLTDASQFQSSGTILVNGNIYSYTGKVGSILSGLSPTLTALNGAVVEGGIGIDTYVNGALTRVGTTNNLITTRYPSRILVSYDNFPEIFDNPWIVNTDASASAIDINSADGQEITGIIPFFGDSAFGSSLQAGVLVVFKQNSIYLVDLSAKAAGQNPVQRLETQGLGCTAPYSIAPTKDGIAFANDSGIYVLRRNQRIEYLGRYIERLWQKSVDKNWLSLVQGHHYGVGRQYKLSVPLSTESTAAYAANSEVYVYNHTGESDGEPGGWARYTNHPATGWANLFQDAFFSTTGGAVKSIRNTGEASDYRDDANAIESVLEARATAFGNTAVRKAVATVTVHYRSGANSNNTSVYMAPDLYQEYDLSSSFRILSQPSLVDGLGTVAGQDVVSIAHSFPKRRCIYMSIKITNTGKDENVEIAGFSYTVAGLSGAGIKQAGETE